MLTGGDMGMTHLHHNFYLGEEKTHDDVTVVGVSCIDQGVSAALQYFYMMLFVTHYYCHIILYLVILHFR